MYFSGRVHTLVYSNPEKGYYVLKMVLDNPDVSKVSPNFPITVVGNVTGLHVKIGTWFGFEAAWVVDPKFGKQLRIQKAPVVQTVWDTKIAVSMLSSHGVGEQVCQKLARYFGEDLVSVLDDYDAKALGEVPDMPEATAVHILATWRTVRSFFLTLDFLSDAGIPKAKITQVWALFGDETKEVLSQNPWALVKVEGIRFEQADEVAKRLGLSMDNPLRIRGAVLYACKNRRGLGHLYLSSGDMVEAVQEFAGGASDLDIAKALKKLHQDGAVILDRTTRPGVLAIYEPWYYHLEQNCSDLLYARISSADPKRVAPTMNLGPVTQAQLSEALQAAIVKPYAESLAAVGPKAEAAWKNDPEDLGAIALGGLEGWAEGGKVVLSPTQITGAMHALTAPVSILTGLPGTGKCVADWTLVSGPWGVRPIGEFLPKGSAPDTAYPLVMPLDTLLGVRDTSHVYDGGVKPTLRLTTQYGYVLEGTEVHPVHVANEDGGVVWKTLGDIQLGDKLEMVVGQMLQEDVQPRNGLTVGEALLLGKFGYRGEAVPRKVLEGGPRVIATFLSNLPSLEVDGSRYVYPPNFRYGYQIQTLLLMLGVLSHLEVHCEGVWGGGDSIVIHIPNEELPAWEDLIQLALTGVHPVPKDSLSSIFVPVVSIEHGQSPVVDFTVPGDHEFLSAGFISHNTTTLCAVVDVLKDAGVPFLLCAPTGIAAKRMSSLTRAPAATVHRAFKAQGWDNGEERESSYVGIVGASSNVESSDSSEEEWGYGPSNPHPAKVILVDEVSMLDAHLLYRVLSCTDPHARLVFVGDPAQLPSVGPGNVLRDMIQSEKFPTVNLTEIFRQEETSGIVLAAHATFRGEVPTYGRTKDSDFVLLESSDEERILEIVVQLATKLYTLRENFQVLSPKHAGVLGVTNLNQRLRTILNPGAPGLQEIRLGSEVLREDDRVMVVKNNYDKNIFNGDVGKVVRIDRKAQLVEVKLHGPPVVHVQLAFKDAPKFLRLAYAVTVHKSQGQEYDIILMPMVKSFYHQLQRNLFYTAITRAKKRVFLVGQHEALTRAVYNSQEDVRNTLLPDRLAISFAKDKK